MNAAKVLEDLKRRFPNEPEYHQAVEEVLGTIEEEYNKHPEFDKVNLIERLCIPDRVYQFRVTWMDDKGNIQTNMGYRVQHNTAIGPDKGGIRFPSSVKFPPFLSSTQFFIDCIPPKKQKDAARSILSILLHPFHVLFLLSGSCLHNVPECSRDTYGRICTAHDTDHQRQCKFSD